MEYKDKDTYCIIKIKNNKQFNLIDKITVINNYELPFSSEKNGKELIFFTPKLTIIYIDHSLIFIGLEVFQLLIRSNSNEIIESTLCIKFYNDIIITKNSTNDKVSVFPLSKKLKDLFFEVNELYIYDKKFISKL